MTKAVSLRKKSTGTSKAKGKRRADPSDIDLSTLDSLIGFHLRRATATIIRDYNRRVLGGKIRPGLASLMRLVATNPGASQVDLSRALAIDKATLVALLDTAEQNNWLRRERSSVDRRRHEIIVTRKGQKVVDELVKQTAKMEKKFEDCFTPDELANLIEYLQRIYLHHS